MPAAFLWSQAENCCKHEYFSTLWTTPELCGFSPFLPFLGPSRDPSLLLPESGKAFHQVLYRNKDSSWWILHSYNSVFSRTQIKNLYKDAIIFLTSLGVTDHGKGLPQKQIQPGLTACKRLTDAVSCANQKNYGMHAGICFISSMHWGMCTGEVVLKSTTWEVSTQWVYVEIRLWRLPPTGNLDEQLRRPLTSEIDFFSSWPYSWEPPTSSENFFLEGKVWKLGGWWYCFFKVCRTWRVISVIKPLSCKHGFGSHLPWQRPAVCTCNPRPGQQEAGLPPGIVHHAI